MTPLNKQRIVPWLAILGLAFGVRLIYLLEIRTNPFFSAPTIDAEFHDQWAQDIAAGHGDDYPSFFRAPLYPYFLGVIYTLFGHNYFIPRLLQILLGSGSCLLIFLIGKRVFNQTVGIAAGIIASFYGTLIYFDAELLIVSLIVFLDLLLIYMLLKAKEHSSTRLWFLSGIILSLSAIARPNILIFVPFALYWLVQNKRFQSADHPAPLRAFGTKTLAFLIGTLLPILPVTWVNFKSSGDFIPIATQGGINFYIGNNTRADGLSAVLPDFGDDWEYRDAIYLAEKESERKLSPSQISRFWYKKGFGFITSHPGSYVKLMIKKLVCFWNRLEVANNKNIYFFRRFSVVLTVLFTVVSFGLIVPLALLGMVYAYKNYPRSRLLLLFIFPYMGSVVLFFVTARYRMPLIPFLIIFASSALVELYEKIRQGKWKGVAFRGLLLIPIALFVNVNLYHVPKINHSREYFALGNAYLKKNNLEEAEENYRQALTFPPVHHRVHLNLGVVFLRQKNLDRAREEFLHELSINPTEEKALNNLGVVGLREGHFQQATKPLQEALRLKPYFEDARLNLSQAYFQWALAQAVADSIDQAISNFHSALKYDRDNPLVHYNLGLAHARKGRLDEALNEMKITVTLDPDFEPAKKILSGVESLTPE